ncbi:hypothetical protein E3N88_31395 [Mikania micrantha]|uniref:SAM domain-containing protein n=1 Tax=Mikania micrantha TaxID=192012 RepID=A0A5N6MPA2_9ASTR|nr:hypothetical protein E3N88_31395 [Mikania micrantha]
MSISGGIAIYQFIRSTTSRVVKRSGAVVDSEFLEPVTAVGIKRPVRDRLGSNADAVNLDNKRIFLFSIPEDFHLSKDDLRFKIMKKSQGNDKQKNVDLRDILSRKQKARSSSTNHKVRQSLPEPGNGRQRAPQQKDDRRCMPELKDGQWDSVKAEPRDDRRLARDIFEAGPRDDSRLLWGSVDVGPRDDRRFIRDPVNLGPSDDSRLLRVPIDVGPRMHKLYDDIQPNLDPVDGSMPSRLTSTRTSRTLSQMDLSKTSFSLETLDQISRPSSHKLLDNSSSLSLPPPPPPPMEEPLSRPLMRAFNDPRPVPYTSRDIHEIPRPMTTSYPLKPAISNEPIKPVGPLLAPQLPTGGMAQQSQYPVEYLSLEGFLHSLGLDKYVISFKVEEIDMATLRQMGENDLKEMGIPMFLKTSERSEKGINKLATFESDYSPDHKFITYPEIRSFESVCMLSFISHYNEALLIDWVSIDNILGKKTFKEPDDFKGIQPYGIVNEMDLTWYS